MLASDEQRHDSWSDAFRDFMAIYMMFCAHPIRALTAPPPDVLVPAFDVDACFDKAIVRGRDDTTLRDEFEQFTKLTAQQQRAAVRAAARASGHADEISGGG